MILGSRNDADLIPLLQRVAQAVVSALGTVADVAHEALFLSVEFLELAPIPGLRSAASTLLNIWDAAQNVDVSSVLYLCAYEHPFTLTHALVQLDEPPWLPTTHGTLCRYSYRGSRRDTRSRRRGRG